MALLALVGLMLALWRLGWARTRVPLALLGAGIATFAGTGVLGLSILPRYLTVPAVAMCVLAGYALAGFTTVPREDPLRRRGRARRGPPWSSAPRCSWCWRRRRRASPAS